MIGLGQNNHMSRNIPYYTTLHNVNSHITKIIYKCEK